MRASHLLEKIMEPNISDKFKLDKFTGFIYNLFKI